MFESVFECVRVSMSVCVFACVYERACMCVLKEVCVCVCERETEIERDRDKETAERHRTLI